MDQLTFHKLTSYLSENISLMHVNIRSLLKHIDELKTVLLMSKIKCYKMALLNQNNKLINTLSLMLIWKGYHKNNQPSKSASGGVVIYVNSRLDHSKIDELSKKEDDFESLWIEIKNNKKKNIICGCIYKHPNTDSVKFIKYIESTLSKTDCNKYDVFLMGDFSIDLLEYESNTISNDFINSTTTHSFRPYILQPFRVTDHSVTLIANIFSNITNIESVSGKGVVKGSGTGRTHFSCSVFVDEERCDLVFVSRARL